MLSADQISVLEENTYKMLADVGMVFEHEEVRTKLLHRGCSETAGGRLRIPRQLIRELVACQKKSQAEDADDQKLHQFYGPGVAYSHFILYKRQKEEMARKAWREFKMSVFGSGPNKFFDYPNNRSLSVTTDIYVEVLKLVRATPEFGYVAPWYRFDGHPRLERLESLILGCKYAPDEVAGVEPMYHEEIKYIKEVGEIMGIAAADNVPYLSGSISINRPLQLDVRNLDQLVERHRRGIRRYRVSSMPTFALSTPATLAGAILLTAAEIVGGMVAVHAVEPEPELTGRVIASGIDMRNAAVTTCSPESSMLNIGVKEVFDAAFGGHLWTEPFFAVTAKVPGLQTMFENFYGAYRYAKLTGIPTLYPGLGNLGFQGTGSPTQAMLDMHVRKAEVALKTSIEVSPETLAYDEIVEVLNSGQDLFLVREHTARHVREIFASALFLNEPPSPGRLEMDEKCLLDQCEQMWRGNVSKYEPPDTPPEKLRALDELLERAKREFLDVPEQAT